MLRQGRGQLVKARPSIFTADHYRPSQDPAHVDWSFEGCSPRIWTQLVLGVCRSDPHAEEHSEETTE
ncbi:hypothetical protein ATANTOWER_030046 [Ataeniobius toweri]|uniref:Uncharacterized protein n=1 Tax=Ataeniobius toweri TaxID=208326 RepID=A0ABU7BA28_9TELE|nr:hypothetical protein [Ataeniobius toweri]